jgi:hypothetical protein
MRSLIATMLIVTGSIVSGTVIARADQLMDASNLLPAPIGHAQPRAEGFAPNSAANRAEQDRLSAFDAQQQKLDEMLNKKLNIFRC